MSTWYMLDSRDRHATNTRFLFKKEDSLTHSMLAQTNKSNTTTMRVSLEQSHTSVPSDLATLTVTRSPSGSTSPGEPGRHKESQAPTRTYWIRTCPFTRFSHESHVHLILRNTIGNKKIVSLVGNGNRWLYRAPTASPCIWGRWAKGT